MVLSSPGRGLLSSDKNRTWIEPSSPSTRFVPILFLLRATIIRIIPRLLLHVFHKKLWSRSLRSIWKVTVFRFMANINKSDGLHAAEGIFKPKITATVANSFKLSIISRKMKDKTTVTERAWNCVRKVTGAIAALTPWSKKQPKAFKKTKETTTPPDKIIPSACRLCYGRCGILGHIRDGRVVKIEGNPDIPNNVGTLCSRAYAIPQLMYSPYRLQYPLKRVGQRGEGKWQRISWDEALDTIAAKIKDIQEKYGGHTIIHQYGTGRDMYQFNAINRFFLELGSTATFGVGNLCLARKSHMVSRRIYGDETQYTGWDAGKTKLIIHWARQERSRGYYDWLLVKEAKKRGAKYIVVDSRFTSGASKADLWLPIRPGSDMALVLAFITF